MQKLKLVLHRMLFDDFLFASVAFVSYWSEDILLATRLNTL